MQVSEIMTREVITVSPETKIEVVADKLTKNRIHGLPVLENGKIVGIITESDFFTKDSFNIHLPSYIDFVKKLKLQVDSPQQQEKIQALMKTTAKDIMSDKCLTVSPDMEVSELIAVFRRTEFSSIPIVDEEGNLKGIVSLADVINLVSHA